MGYVWANSMACHPRATCHIAWLQGAVTWRNQCHDRATLHGVIIQSAIFKIVFRHILFIYCFLMQFWLWRAAAFVSSPIHLFNAEYLRNGTRYIYRYNEIRIGTWHPSQECHFEWPWLTLTDLTQYSVTRSIARSLCDSWASRHIFALRLLLVGVIPTGGIFSGV